MLIEYRQRPPSYEFDAIAGVTGVRILTSCDGSGFADYTCIDELEVYGRAVPEPGTHAHVGGRTARFARLCVAETKTVTVALRARRSRCLNAVYFPPTIGRNIRHDQPAKVWFGLALSNCVGRRWTNSNRRPSSL
jgi:hypothetical protein